MRQLRIAAAVTIGLGILTGDGFADCQWVTTWEFSNPTDDENITTTLDIECRGKGLMNDEATVKLLIWDPNIGIAGDWKKIDEETDVAADLQCDWEHDFPAPMGGWTVGDYRVEVWPEEDPGVMHDHVEFHVVN